MVTHSLSTLHNFHTQKRGSLRKTAVLFQTAVGKHTNNNISWILHHPLLGLRVQTLFLGILPLLDHSVRLLL